VRLAQFAPGSKDPDGQRLAFKWYVYREAGTYRGEALLENAEANKATLRVPKDAAGKTIHVILEATDDGSPSLTAYRRIVVSVRPLTRSSQMTRPYWHGVCAFSSAKH
jgi:hypothetical protein